MQSVLLAYELPLARVDLFTIKPDYSYTTIDFPNDPTDEVTVDWRDFTDPDNAGPDASTTTRDVGVDGYFVITASNISGVVTYDPGTNTPVYSSIDNVIDLCGANSTKFIVRIPSGRFEDKISSLSGAFHCILWAPDDGSNGPSAWITPNVNGTDAITTGSTASDQLVIELRNINVGTPPDLWSVSVNSCFACLRVTDNGGHIIARNTTLRGATFNAVYANKGPNTDPGGTNQKIWLYDYRIYNGGITVGSEHNEYSHSITELRMVRGKSSNSPTHLLKVNGHKVVLIDNWFIDDDPDETDATLAEANAALIDLEGWTDLYAKRNIIETTSNASARKVAFKSVNRNNGMGGPSDKVPYPIDPASTNFAGYRGSGDFEWSNGNVKPDHGTARTSATAAAGATALFYQTSNAVAMDTYGNNTAPQNDLSNTGTDYYRIWVQVKVTATGAYESHETLATSDDAGELTLATAIPTGREVEQPAPIKIVPDGTSLSTPPPNPAFYNKNASDYYFGSGASGINDGTGALNKDKTSLYHSQTVEDCAVVLLTGSSTGFKVFRQNLDGFKTYCSITNVLSTIPLAPIDRPLGAIGGWADDANAGEWDSKPGEGGGFSSVLPSGGTGIQGSDVIWPQVQYFKDVTYHADAGGFDAMWDGHDNNISGDRDATQLLFDGNANYIAENGAVTSLGTSGDQFDGLTRVETTLNGAVSVGATSVVVTSATSIVAGMRVHLFCDGDWGITSKRLFACNVDGSYVSGTTIPLTRSIPKAAASGNRIHFVTAAGGTPPYWQNEYTLHPTEEHL